MIDEALVAEYKAFWPSLLASVSFSFLPPLPPPAPPPVFLLRVSECLHSWWSDGAPSSRGFVGVSMGAEPLVGRPLGRDVAVEQLGDDSSSVRVRRPRVQVPETARSCKRAGENLKTPGGVPRTLGGVPRTLGGGPSTLACPVKEGRLDPRHSRGLLEAG